MDFAEAFLANLYEEEAEHGADDALPMASKKRKLSSPRERIHLAFAAAPLLSPTVHRSAAPPKVGSQLHNANLAYLQAAMNEPTTKVDKQEENRDPASSALDTSVDSVGSLDNSVLLDLLPVPMDTQPVKSSPALGPSLNLSTTLPEPLTSSDPSVEPPAPLTIIRGVLSSTFEMPSPLLSSTSAPAHASKLPSPIVPPMPAPTKPSEVPPPMAVGVPIETVVEPPAAALHDPPPTSVVLATHTATNSLSDDDEVLSPAPEAGDDKPVLTLDAAQLNQVKVVLKASIAKRHGCPETTLMGLDSHVAQVQSLLERTVVHGENQSALLVGSIGTGKRSVIDKAVFHLRAAHATAHPFHMVYLSGSLFQNEIEAFREIVQQLSPDGSIGQRSVAFYNMYDFLKQLLLEKALLKEAVLFVLDDFDAFVSENKAKQLLMYNLLDWMQTKEVRIGLLGISSNFNILSQLEKRVKSRFSNFQIVVLRQPIKHVLQVMWMALQLRSHEWPTTDHPPPPAYFTAYEEALHNCLFDAASPVVPELQYWYDLGKPTHVFLRLAYVAATNLSESAPVLTPAHWERAMAQLAPPHQLQTLQGITTRELTLMLAMIALERQGRTQYSFEMVFQECSLFYRKHSLKLPGRMDALKALDNLHSLQLIHHVSGATSAAQQVQPEYRLLALTIRSAVILHAIRAKQISCTTLIEQWALNGL
ncbi:hypothetical protein ACHHYP_08675 [Achlya hypogyna]|uniref:Origin recognition complex subunit 4 C-terminal domain-containing protein n=1 Tax=Achlya hypogyna TaxID=1202772 RepID=A0A1V9ZKP9_ACHHY|nr:hypothetical protein ACHHYP_08675 [Achlya hypogyna]